MTTLMNQSNLEHDPVFGESTYTYSPLVVSGKKWSVTYQEKPYPSVKLEGDFPSQEEFLDAATNVMLRPFAMALYIVTKEYLDA